MSEEIKCNEPGCVKGKITVFTSIKTCPKCKGKGMLVEINNKDQSGYTEEEWLKLWKI